MNDKQYAMCAEVASISDREIDDMPADALRQFARSARQCLIQASKHMPGVRIPAAQQEQLPLAPVFKAPPPILESAS